MCDRADAQHISNVMLALEQWQSRNSGVQLHLVMRDGTQRPVGDLVAQLVAIFPSKLSSAELPAVSNVLWACARCQWGDAG